MKKRRGFSKLKFLFSLVILGVLVVLGGFVYLSWQSADISEVSGRKGMAIGYVDLKQKMRNAHNSGSELKITESELNQYLMKNLKLKQGGFLKDFATIKGVYVDLKPDVMEVFIERKIAQYGENGAIKTDVFKPFRQTVSMKVKIYRGKNNEGKDATVVEVPGGSIGKAPAPGLMVMLVKSSFDQIKEHFQSEISLGYDKMRRISIGDGFITLDPGSS